MTLTHHEREKTGPSRRLPVAPTAVPRLDTYDRHRSEATQPVGAGFAIGSNYTMGSPPPAQGDTFAQPMGQGRNTSAARPQDQSFLTRAEAEQIIARRLREVGRVGVTRAQFEQLIDQALGQVSQAQDQILTREQAQSPQDAQTPPLPLYNHMDGPKQPDLAQPDVSIPYQEDKTGFSRVLDPHEIANHGRQSSQTLLTLNEDRINPFLRQGRKLELPLRVRNKLIVAVADTGSEINAMTTWLARRLRLKIHREPENCPRIKIGDGEEVQPIGLAVVICSFARGVRSRMRLKFYLFPQLAPQVHIIMGRGILNQTKTLSLYRSRLRQRTINAAVRPRLMQLNVPKRRLACYLQAQLVLACADTGSEGDFISREYATKRGFEIEPVADHERYIILATGKLAVLSGKVKVKFDTFERAEPPEAQTVEVGDRMAPVDESSGSPLDTSVSSKAVPEHCRTFYVFDHLTCDVVLGEELLDSINAFQLHRGSFVDVPDMFEAHSSLDFNIIKWANRVEKWFLDKLHGSNSALSPKAASRLGIDFCPFNPD
jgi:hypothetical protein